jgi:hypothetical protein
MSEGFLAFHSFTDEDAAKDFAEDLENVGIDFKTESVRTTLDSTFIGGSASPAITIKLRSADFEKAHAALNEYYRKMTGSIDKDYYLFSFSDSELFEIIAKPDEWGYLDNQLAQKILADRGRAVDPVTMNRLKESRIAELAKPEKDDWGILAVGYLFIALGLVFLFLRLGFVYTPYGFVIALLTGSLLAYNKKILPDGSKAYSYQPESRKHGKIIMVAAIVILCFSVVNWFIFSHVD